MKAHVFLTGATGFLGTELVRVLVERGRVVHALARASSDRAPLADLPLRWREADVTDAAALERAVLESRRDAADAPLDFVHCAALVSYRTRDAAAAWSVNVEGTRNALDRALRHGIRRFLQVSSIVTLGPSPTGEPLSERSQGRPPELFVDYLTTKRAAEELALSAADRLDVVVVNPVAIFGGGARSNSAAFLRRVRNHGLLAVPPGEIGVVGAADAAEGCVLTLERGRRGERYVLCESNLFHLELARLVARESSVREPLGRIPPWLWSLLERGARAIDRAFPLERVTPQSMRMLASRFPGDSARARAELGWRPRPFGEVLRDALARLDAEGGKRVDARRERSGVQ